MGLEVSRIFALADGSFHIKNTKNATFGTSRKMSQNRTLKHASNITTAFSVFKTQKDVLLKCKYSHLESPMSSYRTCRHLWGLLMLESGGQVGCVEVLSKDAGEAVALPWVILTTAVTVASMVSTPEGGKVWLCLVFQMEFKWIQWTPSSRECQLLFMLISQHLWLKWPNYWALDAKNPTSCYVRRCVCFEWKRYYLQAKARHLISF